MNKILPFGRSCKAYLRLYGDCSPNVELSCSICNRTLHKHGRYYRSVSSKYDTVIIPIYRWLCQDCGITVSLLPDFLVPWARFVTWVREAAINRKLQGRSMQNIVLTVASPAVGISRSTVKRWWKHHLGKASSVSLWIAGQLVGSGLNNDLFELHPSPAASSPVHTAAWLQRLLALYFPHQSRMRGYWPCLNSNQASSLWL